MTNEKCIQTLSHLCGFLVGLKIIHKLDDDLIKDYVEALEAIIDIYELSKRIDIISMVDDVVTSKITNAEPTTNAT